MWNSLPSIVVEASSVNIFKRLLSQTDFVCLFGHVLAVI